MKRQRAWMVEFLTRHGLPYARRRFVTIPILGWYPRRVSAVWASQPDAEATADTLAGDMHACRVVELREVDDE